MMNSFSMTSSIDDILTMKSRERTSYLYNSCFAHPPLQVDENSSSQQIFIRDDGNSSRMKICRWTFNVVDHFDFSRKTAVISMNLFDRFMATRGNRCDPDVALLTAITTIYIAVKLHENKKIRPCSLSKLSRGQFSSNDIEEMEREILKDLSWLVHPPIAIDFLDSLLTFLPEEIHDSTKYSILENARYLTELSVFDPYFIEHHASTVAFSAILSVLDDELKAGHAIPYRVYETYVLAVEEKVQINSSSPAILAARQRLQQTLVQQRDEEAYYSDSSNHDSKRTRIESPASTICKHFDN
mmetsp:Transcript_8990/g.10415  ORF Transcript_8990/g.10415 Transcript_8990/m.10415 type:complete len:299 (-) Transcript_8990:153-1049(-)